MKMKSPLFQIILALFGIQNVLVHAVDQCGTDSAKQADFVATGCRGGFRLPGNFDVSLLHVNITALQVIGPPDNIVYQNFTPLPFRAKLVLLVLYTFNQAPEDPKFPLNGLLVHNKYHIEALDIQWTKLVSLSKQDFNGFNKLKSLIMFNVQLEAIDVNTFQEIGFNPSGNAVPGYHPNLVTLFITGNPKLTGLDWSFLKPVAESLQEVTLDANRISNLTASSPFLLKVAQNISLLDNRIRKLPSGVFTTFNPALPLKFASTFGQYCYGAADCTCCNANMAEFSAWLTEHNQTKAIYENLICRTGEELADMYEGLNPENHHYCQDTVRESSPGEGTNFGAGPPLRGPPGQDQQ